MPELNFQGRKLVYLTFGSHVRKRGTPTIIVISTEYRDTQTASTYYGRFSGEVDGIILDNTNIGQSDRIEHALSADEVLSEIKYVCSALEIERPILTGYCSNAELALYCAKHIENSAAVLLSPLIRIGDGAFIEYFYAAMGKAIKAADAYTLSLITNLVDLHCKGFREQRNYVMADQFSVASILKESEHFWLKTLQNKPVGAFNWEDLPSLNRPVLLLKGAHDPLQPINWLASRMTHPEHKLQILDTSHKILEDSMDAVVSYITEFARKLHAVEAS